MEKQTMKKGQIVQLNPDTVGNKAFTGCLMIVSEPKEFGAQGYVQGLGTRDEGGGQAYYRAKWDEMELCENGMAIWLVGSAAQNDE
jgi:hypothetical protein